MKKFVCFLVFLSSLPVFGGELLIQRRVQVASRELGAALAAPSRIPRGLLREARCVAQLTVLKGGFIFGGEGGTGLVSCRVGNEWSAPLFLNVGGPSVGFQIGGQGKQMVLLFLTDRALELFSRARLELNGEISIAAGPVGEAAAAGVARGAAILSYANGGGLYAGLSAEGVAMWPFHVRNENVYGAHAKPAEILSTPARLAPSVTAPFTSVLTQLAP